MSRLCYFAILVLLGLFAIAPALGQTAPSATTARAVQAELTTTIKAKSSKGGDPVAARTVTPLILAQQKVIPVGSVLRGRVSAVTFDANSPHASLIALSLEEVEIKAGQRVPLNLSIEAVMMPSASAQPDQMQNLASPTSRPLPNDHSLQGGSYPLPTKEITADPNSMGHQGITDTATAKEEHKVQAAQSGSVIGMPGVTLEVDGGPRHAAVFKSAKELRLKSGLQLMLVVPE